MLRVGRDGFAAYAPPRTIPNPSGMDKRCVFISYDVYV